MRIVRVVLLLLAVQCLPDEFRPVDARVRRGEPFELVAIARPDLRGMKRTRIGDVTIYARHEEGEQWERVLNLVAERRGRWFQLRDEHRLPILGQGSYFRPEVDALPVTSRLGRDDDLVNVSWTSQWMGANNTGATRWNVILDFHAKPRVRVAVECSDAGGGGACTAPDAAHNAQHQLACDDDLTCTMRESVWLGWTTRSAIRRFDLLTNATIRPARFDATTFASGAAFAASADPVRTRAFIERIGIVHPIFEVAGDTVLFMAAPHEPEVAVRFFLLAHHRWSEIPLTFLTDAAYPGPDAEIEKAGAIAPAFTPDAPQFLFDAYQLELRGRRKLIEVLLKEGEARSIYWIMLDPAGRTGALRVATDQAEWRQCGNNVHPIAASYLGIPDSGFPALVEAVASWREWDVTNHQLPPSCQLTGTIDWSTRRGWVVRLGQAPCTDPIVRPFDVTIGDDGALGTRAAEISH